jgi:hypothetical protein
MGAQDKLLFDPLPLRALRLCALHFSRKDAKHAKKTNDRFNGSPESDW